ncbi:FtsX-like permease family protein [bacterium]|nr:FtsX-like permease family protein [bacterium]
MRYRTLLAWHLLWKQKLRLLVAVSGIAFANMLIFIQLGFQGALFDSNCRLQLALDADLVVLNRLFATVSSPYDFPRDKLLMCLKDPAVRAVAPLYLRNAEWKNPVDRSKRRLLVIGQEPDNPAFRAQLCERSPLLLRDLRTVFFDRNSRPEFGPIARLMADGPIESEADNHRVRVIGLFRLGASFAADGNVLCSSSTYLDIFPNQSSHQIQVGVIRLHDSGQAVACRDRLQQLLGPDQLVLTQADFAERERQYWRTSTSIGFIFGLGVVIGFIVGVVIVYQVLSSDVNDHLAEYATLKAMGYSDFYLLGVFAQESLFLAILGFIPGISIALAIYHKAAQATTLPLAMNEQRALGVFLATLAMCFLSGFVASFKLRSADPAEIF